MHKILDMFFKLKKRILGELLVDGSFIKKEDLSQALSLQKETNDLIGKLLIQLGAISEEELNLVLKFQEDLSNPYKAFRFATGLRKKLGELLIQASKITEKDLEEALEIQKRTGEKIGQIFVKKGYLSEQELKAILLFQKRQEEKSIPKKLQLGELLVNLGIISNKQLNRALKIQSLNPEKRLGEILVELGYVDTKDIDRCLTLQQKIITIALSTIILFANRFYVNELFAKDSVIQSAKGRVEIFANVKSYVRLNITKQTEEIVLSEKDISNREKVIPNATSINVKTNSNSIFLIFEGSGDGIIEQVEVYGFGETITLGPNGGILFIKNPSKTLSFDLTYKLKLSQKARPGTYAWPYTISVSAY